MSWLKNALTEETGERCDPLFRWVFLIFLIVLFVWTSHVYLSRSPVDWTDYGRGITVPVMLVLNHLAFAFSWSCKRRIFFRILAISGLLIGSLIIYSGFWA